MIRKPRDYQIAGARYFIQQKRGGLLFDPGLGKTLTVLIGMNTLKKLGRFRRALVVAPLRVVYSVWPAQIEEWNFRSLKVSIVHGTETQRRRALRADADLYLINPEATAWLYRTLKAEKSFLPSGLDGLIVDESTRFKNHGAQCWKALRGLLPFFDRRWILTGTPCSNSLEDLYTQIFILDEGERLGRNISAFRNRWFYRGGYKGREWIPFPHAKAEIESAISDLVLRLDAKDWLDLPELVVNDVKVKLPAPVLKAYKKLERELFFELERDEKSVEVTAFSGGAKYNLCRQVANGGIYSEDPGLPVRPFETVHKAKIEALESIFEELSGKPLLVVYQYRHDLRRLSEWKKAPHISGDVSAAESEKILKDWNAGKLPLLYCQPRSMSHGLNMQAGGNDLAWFGLTDDLDVYLQTNARIYRQGVKGKQVRIHRLIAESTVDVAIRRRLEQKDATQKSILDALREYAQGVTE